MSPRKALLNLLAALFWYIALTYGVLKIGPLWGTNVWLKLLYSLIALAFVIQPLFVAYAFGQWRWWRQQVQCDLCKTYFPRGNPDGHGYGECVDMPPEYFERHGTMTGRFRSTVKVSTPIIKTTDL